MPGPHRAPLDPVGQEHQKSLVVIDRTAEVVGELDEHQGLKTTQVSFPGSTTTFRKTFFPPISVPTV